MKTLVLFTVVFGLVAGSASASTPQAEDAPPERPAAPATSSRAEAASAAKAPSEKTRKPLPTRARIWLT